MRRKRDAGFTLLEVMITMLVGSIGLMGTIAVQQAIVAASQNANNAAVAMRLATQQLDLLASHNTDSQAVDSQVGLAPIATAPSQVTWNPTIAAYLDSEGNVLYGLGGVTVVPSPTQAATYRWARQWRVVNTGYGLPYVISVIVTYADDTGTAKTIRLDLERRKNW
ncbi:MAG: prepilin-type N-terminal cleavage/methylation domain-containing protein [Polyangia bacterium]